VQHFTTKTLVSSITSKASHITHHPRDPAAWPNSHVSGEKIAVAAAAKALTLPPASRYRASANVPPRRLNLQKHATPPMG